MEGSTAIIVVNMQEISVVGRLFKFFETNTGSFFSGYKDTLKVLIPRHGMHIRNTSLFNTETLTEHWCNPLHCQKDELSTGSDYIIACKVDNTYKLISYDQRIKYVTNLELVSLIRNNEIANCEFRNGRIESNGTYTITKDIQFEKDIHEKYKIYEAKLALLGRNMSFDYVIEGKKVKLKRYTGKDKDVIIPNFITTIMSCAFLRCDIEAVTLNNGLKYIGREAFLGCDISETVIPQTVKFMGLRVFKANKKLLNVNGTYKEDKIKILNKETTILDQM